MCVCDHIGAGLHGYHKLGCSWKVCLLQTLLCALITALRVCCPAVSGRTEKVHVATHPAAEAELGLAKKRWRRRRCCPDTRHDEAAETVPQLQRSHSPFLNLTVIVVLASRTCCSVISDLRAMLSVAPARSPRRWLLLPFCATDCVLESESHQMVWPSRLIQEKKHFSQP